VAAGPLVAPATTSRRTGPDRLWSTPVVRLIWLGVLGLNTGIAALGGGGFSSARIAAARAWKKPIGGSKGFGGALPLDGFQGCAEADVGGGRAAGAGLGSATIPLT
jgi:hypothetical protein